MKFCRISPTTYLKVLCYTRWAKLARQFYFKSFLIMSDYTYTGGIKLLTTL